MTMHTDNRFDPGHAQAHEDLLREIIALGRPEKARAVRKDLEEPIDMSSISDAREAISKLTRVLWDINTNPAIRSEAARSLGKIGGRDAAESLSIRLQEIYIGQKPESSEMRATLIEALVQALDRKTLKGIKARELERINQVCNSLIKINIQEETEDFITAMVLSLSQLAQHFLNNDEVDLGKKILRTLLNANEPVPTLVAIGGLLEKTPPDTASLFRSLGRIREKEYTTEEIQQLAELSAQYQEIRLSLEAAIDRSW
jgi:hypothetical protein